MRWKKTIQEALWVSALALLLAGSIYALRPKALPITPTSERAALTEANGVAGAFIDMDAAIDHFQKGTAIFADARSVQAFEAGHIPGALHLAPEAFDDWSLRVFSEIAVDEIIITYCDGAQCSLSQELAEKFTWLGYENVTVLKDGWGQWLSNNMPVSSRDEQ